MTDGGYPLPLWVVEVGYPVTIPESVDLFGRCINGPITLLSSQCGVVETRGVSQWSSFGVVWKRYFRVTVFAPTHGPNRYEPDEK